MISATSHLATRLLRYVVAGGVCCLAGPAPLVGQTSASYREPLYEVRHEQGGVSRVTLATRVQLQVVQVPLRVALDQLVRSGVPLVFSSELVESVGPVTCRCSGMMLGEVLRQLTAQTSLAFRTLESGTIVLMHATPGDVRAATVGGRVLAAQSDSAIAGAVVEIVGTGLRAVSNERGVYTIADVPAGDQHIAASMLGYRAQQQTVRVPESGTVAVNFRLAVDPVALNPLNVSVSTGRVVDAEQRMVGNALAVIHEDEIRESGARDLITLLQGRVAGITAVAHGGVIGSGGEIRMRGALSIMQEQAPMVYIDGVPVDRGTDPAHRNGQLDPVESANAAYLRIEDIPVDRIERIEIVKGPAATTMYGTEATNGVIHIFTKRGGAGETRFEFTSEQGISSLNGTTSFLDTSPRRDDIQRDLMRAGHDQRYLASLSGGAGNLTYSTGITHQRRAGVLRGNGDEHTSLQLGAQVTPRSDLTLRASATILQRTTYTRSYRGLFAYADVSDAGGFQPVSWEQAVLEGMQGSIAVSRTFGSLAVQYQPSAVFQARATVGGDLWSDRNDNVGYWSSTSGITRDFMEADTRRLSGSGLISVAYPRTGIVTSTFSAGVDGRHEHRTSLRLRANNLPDMHVTALNLAQQVTGLTDTETGVVNLGVYVEEQVGLFDRLFVTLGLRADGNSSFGANYGMQGYPKVAAAYTHAIAPWWSAKVRTAWGRSGKAPPPFARETVFRQARSQWTDSIIQTFSSQGNPDLRPETGTEIEAGIDQYFLDNRASLEFTYFAQNSRDVIMIGPTIPFSGFTVGPSLNLGGMRSRGIEVASRFAPIRQRQRELSIALTVTHMMENGIVTDLGDFDAIGTANAGAFNPAEGVKVGHSVMDMAFRSFSTDPVTEDNRMIVGSRVPLTFGGANINVRLDRTRISTSFVFGLGGYGWNNVQLNRDFRDGLINANHVFDPGLALSRYVFPTDYLRWDGIRVTQPIPQALLTRGIRSGQLWVQGTNLHTRSSFSGGDVSILRSAARGYAPIIGPAGSFDYNLPVPRSVRVGVQLSF